MSCHFDMENLLDSYRRGLFPMANARHDDDVFLIDPDTRGVLPLEAFHIPRRLARIVRQDQFLVTANAAFGEVVAACAEPRPHNHDTWINTPIINMYNTLHKHGYAHSLECWTENRTLAGGLYGVSVKGAFFGESMFSRVNNASKVALVHLVARLIQAGHALLDAQFHNTHLEQFGLQEISRAQFHDWLRRALRIDTDFYSLTGGAGGAVSGSRALQVITQMS